MRAPERPGNVWLEKGISTALNGPSTAHDGLYVSAYIINKIHQQIVCPHLHQMFEAPPDGRDTNLVLVCVRLCVIGRHVYNCANNPLQEWLELPTGKDTVICARHLPLYGSVRPPLAIWYPCGATPLCHPLCPPNLCRASAAAAAAAAHSAPFVAGVCRFPVPPHLVSPFPPSSGLIPSSLVYDVRAPLCR